MSRYATIALCAAAGAAVQLPREAHWFALIHFTAAFLAGFTTRRWTDGLVVSLLLTAIYAPLKYFTAPDLSLESLLYLDVLSLIFTTVGGLGGFLGAALSSRLMPGEDAPATAGPARPFIVGLCSAAGAATLMIPPLQGVKYLLLLFWSGVAGFGGRRWSEGLFVPLLATMLLIPYRIFRGNTQVLGEMELILFVSPVFLALGALGSYAGSWIARRLKRTPDRAPINT